MQISNQSVDAWLDTIQDDRGDDIRALDALFSDVFAEQSRVLWVGKFWGGTDQTIIGYADLVQKRPKGDPVHWFVVGLALQKANISIYLNAVKDGKYLGQAYSKQLGKVKMGSASIGFTSLADIDQSALRAMLVEACDLTASAP